MLSSKSPPYENRKFGYFFKTHYNALLFYCTLTADSPGGGTNDVARHASFT